MYSFITAAILFFIFWLTIRSISIVQKVGLGQAASSSSLSSGNFTNNTVAGNMIIGVACSESTTANSTISSVTGQGTFQLAISSLYNNVTFGNCWIYFSPSIAGGSKTGVTFNLSAAATDFDVGALEVSGVNSLDQTNHHDSQTTNLTTPTPNSITPGQAASLVVAIITMDGSTTWGAAPTNYTNQFQDGGGTFVVFSADTRILASSSAQNPQWNPGSGPGQYAACIASFVQSAATGTPGKPTFASQEVVYPMHQEQSIGYCRKLWPVPALEIAKSKIILGRANQLTKLGKVA